MPTAQHEKIVWLIGAGASISDTEGHFPSLLELPERARNLGLLDATKDSGGAIQQLQRFLRRRYYGDITKAGVRVDLESVLTLLEIDIAVEADPKLLLIRNYILTLLRRTISALHDAPFTSRAEYSRLVERIGETDSIISFNWDLLLDNAFGRQKRLAIPPGSDEPQLFDDNHYGRFLLDFSGWGARTARHLGVRPPMKDQSPAGVYVKAHGSIDWYHCADTTCRAYGLVYPMLRGKKRPTCSGCLARTSILLVPPTLNKRLRDLPLLRRLWQAAAEEVGAASEIVTWGYSMPPTDFFSEWLLRHARSSRCRRLTIINPAAVRTRARVKALDASFVDRFVSALRLPSKPIRLKVFESYADFEANEDVGTKYPSLRSQLRKAARRSERAVV